MRTSELTGAQLDFWVAKAEGVADGLVEKDGRMCQLAEWDPEGRAWRDSLKDWTMWIDYAPSQRWDQGGPLIERERISVWNRDALHDGSTEWAAGFHPEGCDDPQTIGIAGLFDQSGPTPLIAAMRAYVASKFGEEVE